MTTLNRRRAKWNGCRDERLILVPERVPEIIEHEFVVEEIIHIHEEIIRTD